MTLGHDDLLARFGVTDAGAEIADAEAAARGEDTPTARQALREAERRRRQAQAERHAEERRETARALRDDRVGALAELAQAAIGALNDRHPDCPTPRRPSASFTPAWCRTEAVRLRRWHEAPAVSTTRAAWLARYGWTPEDVERALGEPVHLAMHSRAWPELRRAIFAGSVKPGERFRPLVERLQALVRRLRAENARLRTRIREVA